MTQFNAGTVARLVSEESLACHDKAMQKVSAGYDPKVEVGPPAKVSKMDAVEFDQQSTKVKPAKKTSTGPDPPPGPGPDPDSV